MRRRWRCSRIRKAETQINGLNRCINPADIYRMARLQLCDYVCVCVHACITMCMCTCVSPRGEIAGLACQARRLQECRSGAGEDLDTDGPQRGRGFMGERHILGRPRLDGATILHPKSYAPAMHIQKLTHVK